MSMPENRPLAPHLQGGLCDLTNEQFLQTFFKEAWRDALVAWFPGDPANPKERDWTAHLAASLPSQEDQRRLNMYYCPSLTRDRSTLRRPSQFQSLHVIVIDDIGQKVNLGQAVAILGVLPTYLLQTSRYSYQAGWGIEPLTDLAYARGLLGKFKKALGAGDNLADPMIWRRLPIGINGKTQYRDETGAAWQVRLAGDTSKRRTVH